MSEDERPHVIPAHTLEAALDLARIGMCLIDGDLRYIWVNQMFADMLRYPASELVGKTVLDVTHPDDLGLHDEFAMQVYRGELDNFSIRKRFIGGDGTTVACDVIGTGAFDIDGTPIIGIGLQMNANSVDATARRVETLQRSAAIGQLAASAVHDIRNSLSSIAIATESLTNKVAPQPEHDIIRSEVEAANMLLGAMASFANPTPPTPDGDFVPLSIQSMLEQTRGLLRLVIPAGIGLTITAAAETFPNIEPRTLQQVLMNLILNARDATASTGGAISIDAQSSDNDDYVIIQISDTGTGMTSLELDRAFEPYFTTKGSAGTGLGLPICREIIERQSGTLTLASTAGLGTTATIRLPAAKVVAHV